MNGDLAEIIGFLILGLVLAGLTWALFKVLRWAAGRLGLSPPRWTIISASIGIAIGFAVAATYSTYFNVGRSSPYPHSSAPTTSAPSKLPPEFPWPPPTPSARLVVPKQFFSQKKSLGQVATQLETTLSQSGYLEKSYFSVPRGIAVVTRLEHIHQDGTPFKDPDRWLSDDDYRPSLTISEYLRRLFAADDGYYRIVVFVITNQAFASENRSTTADEATRWLSQGFNILPADLAQQPVSSTDECTALIYEFQKLHGESPRLLIPSSLGAKQHLVASGLYSMLLGARNEGTE